MKIRSLHVAAAFLGLLGVAHAGGLKMTPASALYRCPTTAECVSPDAIAGDQLAALVGDPATSLGAFLLDDGHVYVRLDKGRGRSLAFDFAAEDGPAPCLQGSAGCRRTFSSVVSDEVNGTMGAVGADGQPLARRLYDIPVGGSSSGGLKLNFADPDGRSLLWTIRFSARDFPGTSFVTVTRLATNVWEIEATEADR